MLIWAIIDILYGNELPFTLACSRQRLPVRSPTLPQRAKYSTKLIVNRAKLVG